MPRSQDLPYERVSADLREKIIAGHYRPGEQLPPVTALAITYSVSRTTIVKAVKILVAEGLIVTRERWASFVHHRGQSS
jgi:DNA-binding GntR family transcriptional regulator